jgi:hypothetical protein
VAVQIDVRQRGKLGKHGREPFRARGYDQADEVMIVTVAGGEASAQ